MEVFESDIIFNLNYKVLAIFSLIYFILFAVAEIAYHFFEVNVEYTRKLVHVGTGIIALLFPIYIPNPIDLLVICGSFFVLILLTKKLNLLPSVNAIQRASRGSVLFPLVVVVCYLVEYFMQDYLYFMVPILVLTFADPAAALVGRRWPKGMYSFSGNTKTMAGTIAFVVTAFLISSFAFYLVEGSVAMYGVVVSLVIALLAAFGEALSIRGYDNLVIPLCCIATLLIFQV